MNTQWTDVDEKKMKLLSEYAEYLKKLSVLDVRFLDKHNVFTLHQAKYCENKVRNED